MKTARPSNLNEFRVRVIIICYTLTALTSGAFGYLTGRIFPPWFLTTWAAMLSIALLLEYGRRFLTSDRGVVFFRWLVGAPLLLQLGIDVADWYQQSHFMERRVVELLIFILRFISISLLMLGVRLVAYEWARKVRDTTFTEETKPDTADGARVGGHDVVESNIREESSLPLLGQGNTYLDRVIRSVIGRSAKSESAAGFSLGIMLFLVMIGGGASVGLWAFAHAERIKSLEYERSKLLNLQSHVMAVQDKLTAGSEDAKAQLNRLVTFIDDNYKEDEKYKTTLYNLTVQSQTNAADIAIRVTIAVLTIFLVQVFFAVYKYNHYLADMLAAKAEALELAGNDTDARKKLSREAASIVREGVPGFGAAPRTPIEEATRLAEKFAKRG